jgi:hypothetical protein
MQHFIEFILTHLVKNPAELQVERVEQENRVLYRVSAHPDDIGRIIGARGRTIKAVHQVVSTLAADLNERFEIEIVKEDGFSHPAEEEYEEALDSTLEIQAEDKAEN